MAASLRQRIDEPGHEVIIGLERRQRESQPSLTADERMITQRRLAEEDGSGWGTIYSDLYRLIGTKRAALGASPSRVSR